MGMFSAKMRSSTRWATRSLTSWSNFFGILQDFPFTQTEQNQGHFSSADAAKPNVYTQEAHLVHNI